MAKEKSTQKGQPGSGGNTKEGDSFDLVTIMRLQENNTHWRRSAVIEGFSTLQRNNPLLYGSADREAGMMSERAAEHENRRIEMSERWLANRRMGGKDSIRRGDYNLVCNYLIANYQRNSEISGDIRVFAYRRDTEAGMEGIDLDIPSTVTYLGRITSDYGKLAALLAVEKEMGKNPLLLRELSQKFPFREIYVVDFVREKKLATEQKAPTQNQEPKVYAGRKPKTLILS